ncbi:MAG: NAD(P)-binding domain-containing protein [Candidatus Eremiobacteraeota bacterium]|nr:NAD(P)-binding domain-containing protein [Candidatus Eremiobacteraeota bacterium]
MFDRGLAQGYNTDSAGAVEAVRRAALRPQLNGMRILVLGAGPTARACIVGLQRAGCVVTCWSRSAQHASDIAERFRLPAFRAVETVDAVLSALPPHATVAEDVRAAIARAPVVIDANYGDRSTLEAALGRPVIDGSTMLEASARASFHLFVSEAA